MEKAPEKRQRKLRNNLRDFLCREGWDGEKLLTTSIVSHSSHREKEQLGLAFRLKLNSLINKCYEARNGDGFGDQTKFSLSTEIPQKCFCI